MRPISAANTWMSVATGWLGNPGTRLPAAIFLLTALAGLIATNPGSVESWSGLHGRVAATRSGTAAAPPSYRAVIDARAIAGVAGNLSGRFGLAIRTLNGWTDHGRLASDLSSVEFVPSTNEVALLSDESRAIVTVNSAGERAGMQSLRIGEAGLADTIPQAEGLTFDPDGNLYIVSEPNLFYVLRRN